MLEYARAHLFEPLGIPSRPAVETPIVMDPDPGQLDPLGRMEHALNPYRDDDFAWPVDPQGVHEGSYSLRLRPQDLLKLGQLHLDGGRWDGRQLADESFLQEATSEQVGRIYLGGSFSSSYGYFWWLTTVDGDPAYFSYGYGGQFLAVVPDRQLVVVMTVDYDPREAAAGAELITGDAALRLLDEVAPHFDVEHEPT